MLCCKFCKVNWGMMVFVQLDDLDKAIIDILTKNARASYSEIAKTVEVSVGTARNRITSMLESGALHLNVWLDPYVAGLGVNATLLLRVRAGAIDEVTEALIGISEIGYVATLTGDHDMLVDVFCKDVPHLSRLIHDKIQMIDGVMSLTTYLVTDISYQSSMNIAELFNNE